MATKMTKTSIVRTTKPITKPIINNEQTIAPEPAPPPRHDIEVRAYERFCARGFEHGHDIEDWLAAERDLLQPA